MSLSIIVPTIGRESLWATLESILRQPLMAGDEVLVIGGPASAVETFAPYGFRHLPCAVGGHWGCEERTLGITEARGTHLAFLDDDDRWVPGARVTIADAIAEAPRQPQLFQMRYASGRVLWKDQVVRMGNVSTQMILVPNDPARLGRWTIRREGDHDFLASLRWPASQIVWRPQVLAEIGQER